jgi:stage II sporulation protein D
VALFSTHRVQQVTVAPLGANTWTARCGSCPHQPFIHPVSVAERAELFAGGTLRITDEATHEIRTATGLWHLRSSAASESIDIILTLPSERYVAAVLNAEAAPDEPPQSLRALAIVARTFALNGKHYAAPKGHLDADLCDSTQCQAMLLQPASTSIEEAVRSTAGETLWFGAHRAEVYFSQNCGGITEDGGAVWPSLKGLPYLKSHRDPYCVRRPSSAWHAEVTLPTLLTIANREGWHIPSDLVAAQVAQRSISHRAVRIVFTARNDSSAPLNATALRFGIGRALGWNRVRSDSYELGLRNGALVFDGTGHGHGVGLCQAGAAEMASEGRSANYILAFYFPGTAVRITAEDHGWQEARTDALSIRSTQTVTARQQSSFLQLWSEAQRRFPPVHPIAPMIIFAPTTELFRQLTTQPGWTLASTEGTTVVLQPATLFHTPASTQQKTMLHELLHVAVETACTARTPLWLREGLVELLSGEPLSSKDMLPTQSIEAALQHPASLQQSERAHQAAATKVKLLVDRYGMVAIRGWLSSGVPAGVS